MLYVLDERGKRNWASNVRCKLYQCGFGFAWLNQSINILFYVCSHRGDIRQKQKAKTYYYYLY